jgi:uncharacterized protein YfeS
MASVEELKYELNGVLTSAGGTNTFRQIKEYFSKELGYNMIDIYRKLGVKSDQEFLNKMSDVCSFRRNSELYDFQVFKKSLESSKHMENLTVSQNDKRKAKKAAKRQGPIQGYVPNIFNFYRKDSSS